MQDVRRPTDFGTCMIHGKVRLVIKICEVHAGADGLEQGLRPVRHEIEILYTETFDSGMCGKDGPAENVHSLITETGVDEQARDAAKGLGPGYYEIVGDARCEYDPGYDSPNGPAEPDAWWELCNESVQRLTGEQAGWFIAEGLLCGL